MRFGAASTAARLLACVCKCVGGRLGKALFKIAVESKADIGDLVAL
jgi:hypothetical protein